MSVYLFDFDGTLVDSMPTYAATMKQILKDNRIPFDDSIMKIVTPLGYRGTAEYYVTLGVPQTVGSMMEFMLSTAIEAYTWHIPAKSNVPQVLRRLKSQGHQLNILTASPHTTLDPCLKRLGLFGLFDHIWSCEDFGTTKADPAIYRRAAQRLGAPIDRILFLDDNLNAIKTAQKAGMPVCGVYDDSSADYVDEMKARADFYIRDFSELQAISF